MGEVALKGGWGSAAANPKQVEQYRGGKKTVAAFFLGNVMRLSKGQANPGILNEMVVKKLDGLG